MFVGRRMDFINVNRQLYGNALGQEEWAVDVSNPK